MSKPLIEIEGFEELQRKIKLLPERVQVNEVRKILRASAKPTVSAAKRTVPIGKKVHKRYSGGKVVKSYQPGNLMRSIGVRGSRDKKTPTVYVAPLVGKRRKNDGYYAGMVHGGTKHMSGNPFMDRAFNQTKGQVTADLEDKIAKQIQKQIDRLSTKYNI